MLRGGWSLERSVSLRSGARVEAALRLLGHDPIGLDLDRELPHILLEDGYEVAVIALHGAGGEDGTIQELLELVGLPYTGSGPAACAMAFTKPLAKRLWRAQGLPTPPAFTVSADAVRELRLVDVLPAVVEAVGLPLVAKPARGGSALGVRFARSAEEIAPALLAALSHDREALLERFVDGRDLSVAVVERDGAAEVLPVVEATPREGRDFYDFEARYTPGATVFEAPADLPADLGDEAQRIALAAYAALGCRGPARVDLMLGDEGLQLLELNVVPGMTETSLLPLAAEAAGMTVADVLADAMAAALR